MELNGHTQLDLWPELTSMVGTPSPAVTTTASVTTKPDPLDQIQDLINGLRKFRVDIQRALVYADHSHSFEDVAARVMSGTMLMYPLPNSVILAEVEECPGFVSFHVMIAAGDLQEILDFQPTLVAEAAKFKCKYVTLAGRRGWEKVLREYGWSHKLSIMKLEV